MIAVCREPFGNLTPVPDPTPDPLIPPLLSTTEAAELLGYTSAMVRHLATTGALRGRRVGTAWVFHPATVEAYGIAVEPHRRQRH